MLEAKELQLAFKSSLLGVLGEKFVVPLWTVRSIYHLHLPFTITSVSKRVQIFGTFRRVAKHHV